MIQFQDQSPFAAQIQGGNELFHTSKYVYFLQQHFWEDYLGELEKWMKKQKRKKVYL